MALETNEDGKTFYVDDETGARKEVKLERFDLVPIGPLTELARHYGRGALKYADRNWELGYPWGLSYAALMRHLTQWWDGEDIDPETGSSHLTAVAWHAFALLEFAARHPEFDNRPNSPSVESEPEVNMPELIVDILSERKVSSIAGYGDPALAPVPEGWGKDTWDGVVNDLDLPDPDVEVINDSE